MCIKKTIQLGFFSVFVTTALSSAALAKESAGASEHGIPCKPALAKANLEDVKKNAEDVIQIMRVALVPPDTLNLIQSKLRQPLPGAPKGLSYSAITVPLGDNGSPNPLYAHPTDFYTGDHLVMPGEKSGPPPKIPAKDLHWFEDVADSKQLPDIFIIGGHDVIPEGWHNQAETKHIYWPSLLEAIHSNPKVKKVFDHVKFAVLGGCNTLTDLEPHGPNGEYLDPEQIKEGFEKGAAGRKEIIGSSGQTNTLEFYKSRLAREYGPGTEDPAYVRSPAGERCKGPGKYERCEMANLERIMPESGLYDGSHRYNRSAITKEIFPNAYLVLGFNSASPNEDVRAAILNKTLARAEADLAKEGFKVGNPIQAIVSEKTPDHVRKKVIEAVRKEWTLATFEMNRGRPSGSVTPAYPDVDQGSAFSVRPKVANGEQIYGQYEKREKTALH